MSKSPYVTGNRRRNARENYLDHISQGRGLTTYADRKRKSFTQLRSVDDTELAYRSTSNYLRSVKNENPPVESLEINMMRTLPRTQSVGELNSLTNRQFQGNPKYKAQEDYYDDIQELKKEIKSLKDENSNLRAKNRRLEEDNLRKRKEIDVLYDPSKDGDVRRTLTGPSTDRNNATNVVISLKQRIFKLETQLKEKENKIDEIHSDPKWTRSAELELTNRALFSELERLKAHRLHQIHQYDYPATLEEEQKKILSKLENELKQIKRENESLKRKVSEDENIHGKLTDRSDVNDPESKQIIARLKEKNRDFQDEIDELNRKIVSLQNQSEEKFLKKQDQSRELREEIDELREKFQAANEEIEHLKRQEKNHRNENEKLQEEIDQLRTARTERDEYRGEREKTKEELEKTKEQLEKTREQLEKTKEELRKARADKDEEVDKTRMQRNVVRNGMAMRSSKMASSDSTSINDRPSSPTTSNDSALKVIQATLRGYSNRQEAQTNARPDRSAISNGKDRPQSPPFESKEPPYRKTTASNTQLDEEISSRSSRALNTSKISEKSERNSDDSMHSDSKPRPPARSSNGTRPSPSQKRPEPLNRPNPSLRHSTNSIKTTNPDDIDDDDDVVM